MNHSVIKWPEARDHTDVRRPPRAVDMKRRACAAAAGATARPRRPQTAGWQVATLTAAAWQPVEPARVLWDAGKL